jgi:hypothetical protein
MTHRYIYLITAVPVTMAVLCALWLRGNAGCSMESQHDSLQMHAAALLSASMNA